MDSTNGPKRRKTDRYSAEPSRIQAPDMGEDDGSKPTLLSLPGELRNKIYAEYLIEAYQIEVTATLKPPALLTTSRQIRQECLPIWYLRNKFLIVVAKCDSSLYAAWMNNIIAPLIRKHKMEASALRTYQLDFAVRDKVINWANLLDWCRAVHCLRIPTLPFSAEGPGSADSPYWQVAQAAIHVADKGPKLEWKEV